METVSKSKFANSAFWKILESFSSKGITMVVSMILARLLLPEDYGVIGLTTVFLSLSDILIDGGFSTTLIRKKEVDDCDYSCAIVASFSIAAIIYCIYFFVAPWIANYYNEPIFSPVLRVLGLTVFIQVFTATRTAVVNRGMQFRLLCFSNIIASVISGVVGIITAFLGLGVWAIVIQRLLQSALLTWILFFRIKLRIKWQISFKRFKEIVKFSFGVLGASLLYFVANNSYSVVIGKRYSVTDLGYYGKGNQLPEQFSMYTFSAVSGVLLPTISSYQDNVKKVKEIIRRVIRVSTYAIFPLMVGMMFTSRELITIMFSYKWVESSPIMIGACIYYIGMPFTIMNSQIYYALGYSFIRIKVEIFRLVLMAIGLIVGSYYFNCSISQLSVISGVIMLVTTCLSAYHAGKILDYSFFEMITDIFKPILCTLLMALVLVISSIGLVHFEITNVYLKFIIKVVVAILAYMTGSLLVKADGFFEIKTIILEIIKRHKKGRTIDPV